MEHLHNLHPRHRHGCNKCSLAGLVARDDEGRGGEAGGGGHRDVLYQGRYTVGVRDRVIPTMPAARTVVLSQKAHSGERAEPTLGLSLVSLEPLPQKAATSCSTSTDGRETKLVRYKRLQSSPSRCRRKEMHRY